MMILEAFNTILDIANSNNNKRGILSLSGNSNANGPDVHGGDGISITHSGDTFLQSRTTGTTGQTILSLRILVVVLAQSHIIIMVIQCDLKLMVQKHRL